MTYSTQNPPRLPFEGFKWKWACLQCTEGLNDPVVLLGVLFRMRKLERLNRGIKYNSSEFADELVGLANDLKGHGIGVDLARRTGERNLIRNSGQYWKALGLIPANSAGGVIRLTDLGRSVADHVVSQTEFAALTVMSFTLPNPTTYTENERRDWAESNLSVRPLLLLLQILRGLDVEDGQGYLTKAEVKGIVVPISGCVDASVADYVSCVRAYRRRELLLEGWPDTCVEANDHRMVREFLLFLAHYGYAEVREIEGEEQFCYNRDLDEEVSALIGMGRLGIGSTLLARLRNSDVVSEIERKRVRQGRSRPNQTRFRRAVLGEHPRCVITNVTMPEVLEAAHIVPFKYRGEDSVANGLCMRMDIHQLFDSGHLRLHPNGSVDLSTRARMDYGALIPPRICFPDQINLDFVKWRWDNYNGI